MASAVGQKTDSLIETLQADPYRFDFYAAVRLLQRQFSAFPRIGYSQSLKQDPVRFGHNPALDFASSTLETGRNPDPSRPPVIYSRHCGLFGPNGPLPLCWTEYARDRVRQGDLTFTSFCNVFHHRLLSFFFRAWADAHKTVDLDRPDNQHWAQFVGSVAGLGMETLQERNAVPDSAQLYFAGRFVQQARNAEGLEAILQDFFEIPTEVQTFIGRWLTLPSTSVCRLGRSIETGSLGSTVLVGSRVWTCQLHFRVRMGPMKLAQFQRLLPAGRSFRRVCDWIRQYAGDQFSWELQLVLAKEEVPTTQLGKAGCLGWTTWLGTKPREHHAEDLVLPSPAESGYN